MDINAAFPSNYLKAADLHGRMPKLVMDRVEMRDLGDDHKPVLYFEGHERGLVLNKTNTANIASKYGYETEDWRGKPVWLYETMVDFQGKSMAAIRVRVTPPTNMTPQKSAPQNRQHIEHDLGEDVYTGFDSDDIPF